VRAKKTNSSGISSAPGKNQDDIAPTKIWNRGGNAPLLVQALEKAVEAENK